MARATTLPISSLLLTLFLTAAAAGTAAGQEPSIATSQRTILVARDSVARIARDQIGLRYRLGALQPGTAFDCSALVQWVAGLFGRTLPRTAAQQAQAGLEIARNISELLPGDLLLFGKGKRVDHVGIYVGDGKYVHAANRRKGVIESDLANAGSSYWKSVRRIFLDADSTVQITPRIVANPTS